MQKIVKTIILLLILLVATINSIQFVSLVNANPSLQPLSPPSVLQFNSKFINDSSAPFIVKLSIEKPNNNLTYTDNLPLKFMIEYIDESDMYTLEEEISYSIDNNSMSLICSNSFPYAGQYQSVSTNNTINISNLTNGEHQLTIVADGWFGRIGSGFGIPFNVSFTPILFSIYNTPPPNIIVYAPKNQSYIFTNISSNVIPLNFTVDKRTSWIGYSLDNQNNITITENITLTGLSEGQHKLVMYANDTIGNMGTSQTIYFTIAREESILQGGFSILFVVIVVVATIVALSALFYFKKHKQLRVVKNL